MNNFLDKVNNMWRLLRCLPILFQRAENGDATPYLARTMLRDARVHRRAPFPSLSLKDFAARIGSESALEAVALPNLSSLPVMVAAADVYYTHAYLARLKKPEKIVEFGTFIGMGALNYALNTGPECRIFTIDLPPDVAAADLETSNLNAGDLHWIEISRSRLGGMFKGSAHAHRITQILANSLELNLADHVSDVDLILIDGGHSYECVAADTANAFAVVAPGGLVLWDDYCADYPGVVRFLNELSRDHELALIRGTKIVAMLNGR